MKGLNYKGYFAKIEFDYNDFILVGRVIGVRDVIGFHGTSIDELKNAFIEAIDNYLIACEKLCQKPNKTYSGNLMLRIPAEIHAAVATAADVNGKSINQWTTEVLEKATHECLNETLERSITQVI